MHASENPEPARGDMLPKISEPFRAVGAEPRIIIDDLKSDQSGQEVEVPDIDVPEQTPLG